MLVEGVHGLNMLLVRIAWELLQNTRFENWLRNIIQRPLDSIKRPAFLHPLTLVRLDLGSTAPQIKALRAVAGPMNLGPNSSMWPQLALDVVWVGSIQAAVATKLDFDESGKGGAAASTASSPAPGADGSSGSTDGQAASANAAGADDGADDGGKRPGGPGNFWSNLIPFKRLVGASATMAAAGSS